MDNHEDVHTIQKTKEVKSIYKTEIKMIQWIINNHKNQYINNFFIFEYCHPEPYCEPYIELVILIENDNYRQTVLVWYHHIRNLIKKYVLGYNSYLHFSILSAKTPFKSLTTGYQKDPNCNYFILDKELNEKY